MADNRNGSEPTRLESWKEIGAYLQRDVRTARRWELEEGLPVHRHAHSNRASVYAYASEIDAWRASRKVAAEPPPPLPLWKTLLAPPRSLAFGVTLTLCLLMVGNGIRPQAASAQGRASASRQVWVYGGNGPTGAPSGDGRYIGFTDWSNGDLVVRDLVAGSSRRLVTTGGWVDSGDYAEESAISRDNGFIAYLWFIDKDKVWELRVLPLAGGSSRTLYRSRDQGDYMFPLDWTPDNRRILVLQTTSEQSSRIAMVSVDDGSVQVIKSLGWQQSQARLSPDGRFSAYDRPVEPTGNRDIFLLATDGSSERTLAENPGNDQNPIWSPDGKQVLFMSDRTGVVSLWSAPVEDGKPAGSPVLVQAQMAGKKPVGMTRDGVLYFTTSKGGGANVYVADLDPAAMTAGTPRPVAERFVNANSGPAISPDGRQLAYYTNRPGLGIVTVVRTLENGQERDVSAQRRLANVWGHGPMWFPDGSSVLVVVQDTQRPGSTLARTQLADGTIEVLRHVTRLHGYALSPDGKSLYSVEQGGGEGRRLVRIDLATKRETELARDAISVAVSPDGRQVAFLATVPGVGGRESYIAVVPAEGGEPRVVYRESPWLDDAGRWNGLAWSPDGKTLLFQKREGGQGPHVLWKVAVGGGPAERVGITRQGSIRNLRMTPDGRQIFFSSTEDAPGELWTLENFLPAAAGK